MKEKIRGTSLIMAVAGLLLAAGSMTIFSACLPKADGSYMNCHNAQIAVAASSLCLAVLFLAGAFVRNNTAGLLLDAAGLALCAVGCIYDPGDTGAYMQSEQYALPGKAQAICQGVRDLHRAYDNMGYFSNNKE